MPWPHAHGLHGEPTPGAVHPADWGDGRVGANGTAVVEARAPHSPPELKAAGRGRPVGRDSGLGLPDKLTLEIIALASSSVFFRTSFIFSLGAAQTGRGDAAVTTLRAPSLHRRREAATWDKARPRRRTDGWPCRREGAPRTGAEAQSGGCAGPAHSSARGGRLLATAQPQTLLRQVGGTHPSTTLQKPVQWGWARRPELLSPNREKS